jgi:hypothetical protein
MSKVICKWCGEQFEKEADTPKEKMRYYHKECYAEYIAAKEKALAFTDKIVELYDSWCLEPDWTKIVRQLKRMLGDGKTYEVLIDRLNKYTHSPFFDLEKAEGGIGFLFYEPYDTEPMTKEQAVERIVNDLGNEEID